MIMFINKIQCKIILVYAVFDLVFQFKGGACSLKNDQMLGKPNGDDLRNVYPPLHMTSSTCISSNGNALLGEE